MSGATVAQLQQIDPKLHIHNEGWGHDQSRMGKKTIDNEANPLAWHTYQGIEYLRQIISRPAMFLNEVRNRSCMGRTLYQPLRLACQGEKTLQPDPVMAAENFPQRSAEWIGASHASVYMNRAG